MPNRLFFAVVVLCVGLTTVFAEEPPSIQPFGEPETVRDDARPGVVVLSDGTMHRGLIYLTREKPLQIYDAAMQRQREVPLEAVQKIECAVQQEWLEKQWRFKEGANDEKVYAGRAYPVREYVHTITLSDGRTIRGPLSVIVYVEPKASKGGDRPMTSEPERFMLKKRDKGEPGQTLKSLVYVKRIELERK
jgi:hypothetical protein